jgi:PAS domain S-box-containing protein
MSDDFVLPFNQPEQLSFQTLQARLSQLEAALVQVEQAIVCTDRHGQIEWCNPGFEQLVSNSQAAMRQRVLLTVLPLEAEDAAPGTPGTPLVHPVQQAIAGQPPQPTLYRFWQGDRAVMLQFHWSQAADQSWVFAIDRVERQPTELAASKTRSELALASILQGTASATGADFFPVLVQNLVTALDVQYAIVTERLNETQIGSLAFWANGQLQTNGVFELAANSCCQQVVDQGLVACSADARQAFPTAQILEALAAESYLGVALQDAEGRAIGTLCILDTRPLRHPTEAEALLRIFAARATAELERQRAIAALHQLNQELEARVAERTQELQQSQLELQHQTQLLQTVLNSLGDGVAVMDKNNNLLVINPAACRILGIGEAENPANLQDQYAPYLSDRVTLYPPDQTPMHRAMRGEAADNVEVFLRRSDLPDRPGVLLDVSLRPLCNSAGEAIGGVVTFRDITQRRAIEDTLRQREATLRESEEQLRAIFEHVPIAISLADIKDNYRIVRRNAAHRQLVGYSETEILQITIADYTHPDDLADDFAQMQRLLDGEISRFQMQKRYRSQTGEYIWVKLTAALIRDAEGNPRYALGMSEDITKLRQREADRQLNEAALRKSETRLRRVIDSSIVGVFFALRTGEITEANDSFLQTVGYTPEDVAAGRLRWDALTPPEYHVVDRLIDQELLLHRASSIHEKEYFHQDGSRIPVLLGVTLIEEDQNDQEVVFVLNISDRKQTERRLLVVQDQLLIAQERLQHLLCSSPAMIYSATPGEMPMITFISSNVSQVLGYEASECLSSNFWLTHLHPDDLMTCRTGRVQLLQQGYVAIEYRFRHQDGSYRWLYDQSQLVRDETGNMLEQIGSWIDISERKRDEAERKRAEEQLYQINQRLALTNAELAHATRLKDEFLANMSHELRTPLNSIIGLSEVMQEQVFGALTAKQHQFLETIQSSGKHLLDLINDILDLAKIEAGMLELNLTETSIHSLCEASLALMRQQAIQKNITLRSELLDPAPSSDEAPSPSGASADILNGTIRVDERRIRQVLINLLSNAIKFTPEGGIVTLTVRSTQDPSDQKYLSFSVTDTGIGIASQDLHKLFQTFVQIDSSIDRHYEGTGLGLALVKQITEMHHGQVSVESSPGLGSCFTITLPWIQVEEQLNQLPELGISQSTCCILLAESYPDSAATIADYLQIRNFEVILAHDGLAVIQQAIARRPQLILMNLQLPKSSELPGLDGLEVIRRIRAHPDTASIPLVVLTVAATLSEQASCLSVGANDYIAKPIRLKQLVSLIQTYVRSKINQIKDESDQR